jgi:hypothetical protein
MAAEEPRIFRLGYHLVAFLDVLGQRPRFRQLRLPKTKEEEVQVKEVLQSTAGFVLELRRLFQSQFEAFESGLLSFRRYTQAPLQPNFIGFSDSFVTSVPLRNVDGGDLARVAIVFSALSAAGIVMLSSLVHKHPLRGGIDVGLATEIGPGEIYGTALERAYFLESKVAQYPRIVIGDGLWNYLTSALNEFEQQTTGSAKAVAAIVQRIRRFITTDFDGKRILDYLGAIMAEQSAPSHADQMVRPAYNFVLAEQTRVAAEGNQELIERYRLLRSYFETRLPLWGLQAQKRTYKRARRRFRNSCAL